MWCDWSKSNQEVCSSTACHLCSTYWCVDITRIDILVSSFLDFQCYTQLQPRDVYTVVNIHILNQNISLKFEAWQVVNEGWRSLECSATWRYLVFSLLQMAFPAQRCCKVIINFRLIRTAKKELFHPVAIDLPADPFWVFLLLAGVPRKEASGDSWRGNVL